MFPNTFVFQNGHYFNQSKSEILGIIQVLQNVYQFSFRYNKWFPYYVYNRFSLLLPAWTTGLKRCQADTDKDCWL